METKTTFYVEHRGTSGIVALLIVLFIFVVNNVVSDIGFLLILSVLVLVLLGRIIFSFGYKVTLGEGEVKEYFFGTLYRSVKIQDVNQVDKVKGMVVPRGIQATYYNLKGNFNFKRRFPLVGLQKGFLDNLLALNSSIVLDPYFYNILYKETRDKFGLQLTGINKSWVPYLILGLFFVVMIVGIFIIFSK